MIIVAQNNFWGYEGCVCVCVESAMKVSFIDPDGRRFPCNCCHLKPQKKWVLTNCRIVSTFKWRQAFKRSNTINLSWCEIIDSTSLVFISSKFMHSSIYFSPSSDLDFWGFFLKKEKKKKRKGKVKVNSSLLQTHGKPLLAGEGAYGNCSWLQQAIWHILLCELHYTPIFSI